jgi:hypothetical protein
MASGLDPAEHLTRLQSLAHSDPGTHRFEREADDPGLEYEHRARSDPVCEHDPAGPGCDHRLPATGLEVDAAVCRQPVVRRRRERPDDNQRGYRRRRREGEHRHELIDTQLTVAVNRPHGICEYRASLSTGGPLP